ncbi:unnamed protein product [Owenia fusiformis]|uniref:Hexosyltransferase n=1 Tax=Owenia fusiformis TaxID=6347 RepID=A0A8J1T566_OWEFU|nr:unnamed protein product [Owenia fusiformis]
MLPRKSTITKWLMFVLILGGMLYTVINNNASPVNKEIEIRKLLEYAKDPIINKPPKGEKDLENHSGKVYSSINSSAGHENQPNPLTLTPPVNPHNFKYMIKPKYQCDDSVFLVVYVHSHPDYYKRRILIRQTWGNPKNYKEKIRVIFIMGKGLKQKVQDSLMFESETYGDIVQEDFIDSYKNLTYKGIAGLKWVSENCAHTKYTLKTDDDIFVNMFNLLRHLKSISMHDLGRTKLVLCLTWHAMKVLRDKNSKWYIAKEEFEPDHFPPYCSGSAFIFSTDVVKDMFEISLTIKFFWVDDYYITGALVNKLGLNHTQFISVYSLQKPKFEENFSGPKGDLYIFAHTHEADKIRKVWKRIISKEGKSMKSDYLLSS